ncbi:hypothetical protein ACOSQ2_012317 [Xanthoceras sorbifolium]
MEDGSLHPSIYVKIQGQLFPSINNFHKSQTSSPGRVKLLTQCQNEMIKSGRLFHPNRGIGDCFTRTIRNEAQIFSLGTRIALKPLVQLGLVLLVLQHNLLAGSTAGFGLDTIYAKLHTYPMDIVRRRMMMRSEEAVKYKNWLDAVSQILKNEGVKSFYKGVGAEMLRMPLLIGVSWLFLTYH